MKRLSNKKYLWTGVLWFVVVLWLIGFILMFASSTRAEEVKVPFCKMWHTMGDMDGGEPVTPGQRKMFHLGFFLTKSDTVRIALNQHYNDALLIDRTVTCYEENTPVLVQQVDDLCGCSSEDKQDEMVVLWNNYINDCVREAKNLK